MENILIIRTETQLIAVPSRKPMQAILLDSLCSLEEYEYRSSVARRNREPSIHFRTILLDSPPKGGSLEEYKLLFERKHSRVKILSLHPLKE